MRTYGRTFDQPKGQAESIDHPQSVPRQRTARPSCDRSVPPSGIPAERRGRFRQTIPAATRGYTKRGSIFQTSCYLRTFCPGTGRPDPVETLPGEVSLPNTTTIKEERDWERSV